MQSPTVGSGSDGCHCILISLIPDAVTLVGSWAVMCNVTRSGPPVTSMVAGLPVMESITGASVSGGEVTSIAMRFAIPVNSLYSYDVKLPALSKMLAHKGYVPGSE